MNKQTSIFISFVGLCALFFLPLSTRAEIIVQDQEYSGTNILNQNNLDKLKNFFTGKEITTEVKDISEKTSVVLEEKAGIDIKGILKTIGTWFVFVVQIMIDIVKWLIAKI